MEFLEVQRVGEWWLWAIMVAVSVPFAIGAFFLWRATRRSRGGARALLLAAAFTTVLVALAPPGLLASVAMRTTADAEGLHVAITPLLLDTLIPYARIESARTRRYDPLGEYGGWGIRFGRSGRAYNMTGDRGVQLELRGGGHLLIGSQRPEELVAVLERHLGPAR